MVASAPLAFSPAMAPVATAQRAAVSMGVDDM